MKRSRRHSTANSTTSNSSSSDSDFSDENSNSDPHNIQTGSVQIGEQGFISPRKQSAVHSSLTRMKAQFSLQMQRYTVFQSPEYKQRMYTDLRVPEQVDAASSSIGLLRTALDPTFRDRQLGENVWLYTDGVQEKQQVRQLLIREACDNYEKDMRRGRYSVGSSQLKYELMHCRSPVPLRRSQRILSRKLNHKLKKKI